MGPNQIMQLLTDFGAMVGAMLPRSGDLLGSWLSLLH
ncbi:hypothetical protein SKPI104516_13630 [Skermania piniformis]